MMTTDEYLKSRLDYEIDWYNKKSGLNKKLYYFFKTVEILLAASLPFLLATFGKSDFGIYIGLMSVLIAIISGLLLVFKFHEKWIKYRTTCETLTHEKFLFLTNAGVYKLDNSLHILSERIEFLISKENSDWSQLLSVINKTKSSTHESA